MVEKYLRGLQIFTVTLPCCTIPHVGGRANSRFPCSASESAPIQFLGSTSKTKNKNKLNVQENIFSEMGLYFENLLIKAFNKLNIKLLFSFIIGITSANALTHWTWSKVVELYMKSLKSRVLGLKNFINHII